MAPTTTTDPAPRVEPRSASFRVQLENFSGPYDLLLSLIARKKLDITDIALAEVTDEFMAYISALYERDTPAALDQASDFLVTAATLLDLKAARLLPRGTVDVEEDVALIEARDLLFARLLQYRAYKEVAEILGNRYAHESHRFARSVALEPQFAQALPALVFDTTAQEFARIAAQALGAAPEEPEPPTVDTEHLRAPLTTIAEQEAVILEQLGDTAHRTLADLLAGAAEFEVAVVRFLAVLELCRRGDITASQEHPLGATDISVVPPEKNEATVDAEGGDHE
ncbi:ScpA family protein [Rothia sp. LK2588]|uniref:ScpA family protein n=1 Tax=Rothia sp. LK2588 TaxID=3114369 RepID=UPI0034CD80B0